MTQQILKKGKAFIIKHSIFFDRIESYSKLVKDDTIKIIILNNGHEERVLVVYLDELILVTHFLQDLIICELNSIGKEISLTYEGEKEEIIIYWE